MSVTGVSAASGTPNDSFVARCNPTVKAAVLLTTSLAVLALFDPRPVLVLAVVSFLAVRLAARVPWRTLVLGLVPFVLFAFGIVSVNALTRPGTEVWPDLPVRITVEGLSVGAALALRAMLIGTLTIAFLATTPPRSLLVSLMTHARLSPRYAYAILAGHRMLGAMPERWATIRAAQSVRAPLRRDGTPRFGLADAGRAAFALLVTSIRSSERIALALETRGLGEGPRTIRSPVPIGMRDVWLAATVACTFGAVIAGWFVWSGV